MLSIKKNKIRNIIVLCTHALLLDNALEIIMEAGVHEIISTNSIPNNCSKVDLAPILSNVVFNTNY